MKQCGVTIGSYNKQNQFTDIMEKVFESTNLILDTKEDMNVWLKYHSALITPICLAVQYEGPALYTLCRQKRDNK